MSGCKLQDANLLENWEMSHYLNDFSNYRECKLKMYTIWACIPNSDYTDVYSMYRHVYGNAGVTSELTDEKPVLIAFAPENGYEAISVRSLCRNYLFMDGTPVTPEALEKKRNELGVVNWFQLKAAPSNRTYYATCIPTKYQHVKLKVDRYPVWVNDKRNLTKAAIGDFVIRSSLSHFCDYDKEEPPFVMQGDMFIKCFDNRGWSDCIKDASLVEYLDEKPKLSFTVDSIEKAVKGLFSSLVPEQNITAVLTKIGKLSVEQRRSIGEDLQNFVQKSGSPAAAHFGLIVWRDYKKIIFNKLSNLDLDMGIRRRLKEAIKNPVGVLDVRPNREGEYKLMLSLPIYEGSNIKNSKYVFNLIDEIYAYNGGIQSYIEYATEEAHSVLQNVLLRASEYPTTNSETGYYAIDIHYDVADMIFSIKSDGWNGHTPAQARQRILNRASTYADDTSDWERIFAPIPKA